MSEKELKIYSYVGSTDIKKAVANYPVGTQIISQQDIKNWCDREKQKTNYLGLIAATFIVDLAGYLCISDRHSEHIACAGGKAVLSAGEIFFAFNSGKYEVREITNQSTGFCPEPKSWFWVAKALDRIPLDRPNCFTTNFIFRRCRQCNQLNIVKDNIFICAACNAELTDFYNCDLLY